MEASGIESDIWLGYLVTGTVWGVTNAFIERGSKDKAASTTDSTN